MNIIDAGHKYALDILDGIIPTQPKILLQFVKREGEKFPFNQGSYPGTNCQEVLRALIDRCEYLNHQDQCAETESIIGCLKTALVLFELRAARRHDRHLDLPNAIPIISGPYCKICGHVNCQQMHQEKK